MPEFAKLIEVVGGPGSYSLVIDGEDFPWLVADGPSTSARRGEVHSLTISIPAERIVFAEKEKPPPSDWLMLDSVTDDEVARCSTMGSVLERDVVRTEDGTDWRVERINVANKLLYVSPYE